MIQVYKATSCHSKSAEADLNNFLSEHKDYKVIDIKPYPNDGNVNGCALLLIYEVEEKEDQIEKDTIHIGDIFNGDRTICGLPYTLGQPIHFKVVDVAQQETATCKKCLGK